MTRTGDEVLSGAVTAVALWAGRLMTHPDALRPLEALALGLQGGGDHDLGLLELLHRLVTARGHGGPEGAEQVEPAIVLVGGAHQDLFERSPGRRLDPGAP